MNNVVETLFQNTEFFSPASTDMIDGMVARYNFDRQRIAEVVEFSKSQACQGVMHYFLSGNATEERGRMSMSMSVGQLFQEEGAVHALNAKYWSEALDLTDVYDAMPQDRRNQWNEQIRNPAGVKKHRDSKEWETPPLPDFEEETVRATLIDLLNKRTQFLAERVDGIFRALSGEHVTNSPAAFGKRMIIAHLVNSWGGSQHDRVGYINDLRCVIAKFMGRDEPPSWNSTSRVVAHARKERRGEWVILDGGSLRLRAYKCGTAHLEVHPDMAWRLNSILAHLHPMAIPPEFRTKPKKKPKEFAMMSRPLPFAVVELLASMKQAYKFVETGDFLNPKRKEYYKNSLDFERFTMAWDKASTAAKDEAERVMEFLGGVKQEKGWYQFDYDPREVIADIVCTGCLPDQKAHQYYPTPANVAAKAIELAQIGDEDECLEPSAGQGGLADLMPKDRTLCIEISALHCKVLEAKGHKVQQADFLKIDGLAYGRIIMNPPFSEGRWKLHLEHAASMLRDDGRLVAILPSSAKGKTLLPGWSHEWSKVFENEFSGTSVDVVILVARKGRFAA
ncbi:DUF4942 domain-containing protein [Methylobacillus sp.]|uniref:DUF4942 domain-containing protein n=1 Tax=Methylobacillus sp. TaxID=56818 RepID=UPI002FDF327D